MNMLKSALLAAALCLPAGLALSDIVIRDAYARSSGPAAPTGAAFMTLENTSDSADRLVGVTSDAARRVELHSHVSDANGVMKMTMIEGGIDLPAHQSHVLKRGGDHVMMMGLNDALVAGSSISMTLIFEKAGEITVDVPIDPDR